MTVDLQQKLLEDYPDIFSDILNVLLFNGEQIIQPNDLEDFLPKSQYKAEKGALHEEERDVAKRWKKNHFRIASFGLENQTRYERFMPLRIIGYDGANYREQLLVKNIKRTYPVISIVLNFSMRRWKSHLHLRDCLDIPACLSPYVNDYQIHVFNIAFYPMNKLLCFAAIFGSLRSTLWIAGRKRDFISRGSIPTMWMRC